MGNKNGYGEVKSILFNQYFSLAAFYFLQNVHTDIKSAFKVTSTVCTCMEWNLNSVTAERYCWGDMFNQNILVFYRPLKL